MHIQPECQNKFHPSDHTRTPHGHLYFGYKMPVQRVSLGLTSIVAKEEQPYTNYPLIPSPTQPQHSLASIHDSLGCTFFNTPAHKRCWHPPPPSLWQTSNSLQPGAFVCGACAGTTHVQVRVSLVLPLVENWFLSVSSLCCLVSIHVFLCNYEPSQEICNAHHSKLKIILPNLNELLYLLCTLCCYAHSAPMHHTWGLSTFWECVT